MATSLAIDPDLLERAQAIGGEKTKKATVTVALEEYIARRAQAKIIEHFHTLEWDKTYDYKESRRPTAVGSGRPGADHGGSGRPL